VHKDDLDKYAFENLSAAKYAYKAVLKVDDKVFAPHQPVSSTRGLTHSLTHLLTYKVVAPHQPVSSIARTDGAETHLIVTLPTPSPLAITSDFDSDKSLASPTRPSRCAVRLCTGLVL